MVQAKNCLPEIKGARARSRKWEHNPASDLDVVALPKPPVSHNPFLRMDELPALMTALRNDGGEPNMPWTSIVVADRCPHG